MFKIKIPHVLFLQTENLPEIELKIIIICNFVTKWVKSYQFHGESGGFVEQLNNWCFLGPLALPYIRTATQTKRKGVIPDVLVYFVVRYNKSAFCSTCFIICHHLITRQALISSSHTRPHPLLLGAVCLTCEIVLASAQLSLKLDKNKIERPINCIA